jgi:Fe-S-cluster containining protein
MGDTAGGGTMRDREKLFLTRDQALEALGRDFMQYPAQMSLLSTLVPMICGDSAYLMRDAGRPTVWLKTPELKRPLQLHEERVGEWLVHRLKAVPPSIEQLAAICTRVFQTSVTAVAQTAASPPGVRIHTGMDAFSCRMCGRCCRTLDYRDGCSLADYRRWVESGRTDILRWVGVVREKGRTVACRIWIVPGTNRFAVSCPWLKPADRPDRYVCSIHDVRPTICRQYPGTRKHARMTGCRGF